MIQSDVLNMVARIILVPMAGYVRASSVFLCAVAGYLLQV
jgi:hypothetical protein